MTSDVPSGKGIEILRDAAEEMRARKNQSEKETFTTKEGKTVTWWTETDKKDRDYKMYCYEVGNGDKSPSKYINVSQLTETAKTDQTALEIYCKVKGYTLPASPELEGSVDIGDSIWSWRTSPVPDEATGKPGYSVSLTHKGDKRPGEFCWMTLEQIEKESRSETVGQDYMRLLNDINSTRNLSENHEPNSSFSSAGGSDNSSHSKGLASCRGYSRLSKL
ncbi:hypothetical protein I302_100992 [Kwoniella bestiolae CBS 10118]|uniref:Uncharacterized protein n=1 Tax=Kwoniella bestiolae CBS 10118 TaxID=1296100 RepID=A0A1B9G6Q1_9TREE|nr:hypothetical protein I302_04369 [Kwoniella bestiolae CBS 10118]OCF26682.1 hypothetical protein I302_04369 [Kwoniella bestiolae CBS 10118]